MYLGILEYKSNRRQNKSKHCQKYDIHTSGRRRGSVHLRNIQNNFFAQNFFQVILRRNCFWVVPTENFQNLDLVSFQKSSVQDKKQSERIKAKIIVFQVYTSVENFLLGAKKSFFLKSVVN